MICLPSPIVLKYRLIKQRNELLGHLVVYRSKSLSCTLSAVDVSLSLLTFLINTSRYTSTTTSTRVLREVSYSKRPHGTQLQRGFTTSVPWRFIETAGYVFRLPELSQKCHPSTRGSTRSLLRTLCTAFTLAFFTGSKKAWDWISNGSLQSHSLAAFSCRGGQSVTTHFCVDKPSELQTSLVGELTSTITLILMRRAGN